MEKVSTPSSYNSPLIQAKYELKRARDNIKELEVDYDALQSEFSVKEEELKKALDLNAKLQAEARKWKERCSEVEEECEKAEGILTVQEEIQQENGALQKRIKELLEELDSMKDRSMLNESVIGIPNIASKLSEESFRDEEIQQLQEKLREAEISLDSHQTALQKLQIEVQERDRLIKEINEELQNVRLQKAPGIPLSVELRLARYDAAKIRMAALEADFATLQTTYNELLASATTEKAELQNNLQTISDELSLLRTNADSQLQNALTKNTEQDATIQRQAEELLKSEMDRVNLELKVTEVEQELLQLKEEQRKETEASRKKYEMEIGMLQSRLEEKEKFARSLEARLERQIHLLQQQMSLKISESKVEAAKKDQEIAVLNADLKMLRQNLSQEQEARANAQDEIKDLRTQVSELRTKIEFLEAAKPVLEDSLLQDNQSNCGSGKLRTGLSSMMPPAASMSTCGFKAADEKDSLNETMCSSDPKSSLFSSALSIGTIASTTTRPSSALSGGHSLSQTPRPVGFGRNQLGVVNEGDVMEVHEDDLAKRLSRNASAAPPRNGISSRQNSAESLTDQEADLNDDSKRNARRNPQHQSFRRVLRENSFRYNQSTAERRRELAQRNAAMPRHLQSEYPVEASMGAWRSSASNSTPPEKPSSPLRRSAKRKYRFESSSKSSGLKSLFRRSERRKIDDIVPSKPSFDEGVPEPSSRGLMSRLTSSLRNPKPVKMEISPPRKLSKKMKK